MSTGGSSPRLAPPPLAQQQPLAVGTRLQHFTDLHGHLAPGLQPVTHRGQLFTRHGHFDLTLRCRGDLAVDCHHTIEDVGIVLGSAIRQALGDKQGIARFGSCLLPMDETPALFAVDLGGRPYFVYDAAFAGPGRRGSGPQLGRGGF